jgi:hypothetical protein
MNYHFQKIVSLTKFYLTKYWRVYEKDILCNDGVRHCLEPSLLETKGLLATVKTIYNWNKQCRSVNLEYNSPSAEEDFAPEKRNGDNG